MKKLVLVLSLSVFITTVSFCQLSVSSSNRVIGYYADLLNPAKAGSLSSYEINGETEYDWSIIIFENAEGKNFVKGSIKFKGNDKLVDDLYYALSSRMSKENLGKSINITLGNTPLEIVGFKVMGVSQITIKINNGYLLITEKQLNKLFGKA